jgi:biotin carboxyl carrier protein
MKKLLLWILMVVLFVALLLGGSFLALYMMTGTSALPDEAVTLGSVTLQNSGYDWQVPILGGVVEKKFYSAPTLTVQKLGDLGGTVPQLVLPAWADRSELELIAPDGTVALSGTAADYSNYTYTQNGSYELTLKLYHSTQSTPAKATGWYRYRASYTVSFQPQVKLSANTVSQGAVAAVAITGILDGSTPTAETDLGTVWFRKTTEGWMGYVPVTYNAEAGNHTITLTFGAQTVEATLTVTQKTSNTAEYVEDSAETAQANQEYRDTIWPLYTTGDAQKAWTGAFAAPVTNGALVSYGTTWMQNGSRAGAATGITYSSVPDSAVTAPQAGTVVYAGTLALTGGTVVIDHGCGVKSYLYGLETVVVQKGQQIAKGDALGTAGESHQLIYELRIGSKTVDPNGAIEGTGGLQYRENA